LVWTERLSTRGTVLAGPAGVAEPRDGHPVSLRQSTHSLPQADDDVHPFMARHEGWHAFHRPVTVRGVDVRVAQTASLHLHLHLAVRGGRNRPVLNPQRLLECSDHSCLHRIASFVFPLIGAAPLQDS
jgi:hypothetical protein